MRVALVDTATEWRGGQAQTLLLARGLAELGVEVTLACPPDGALWAAVGEGSGMDRLALPAGRRPRALLSLAALNVDLFAAQTSHAHSLCALLRRPLVVHRRVDFRPSGGWKYGRPDAYIAVSEAVARILRDAGARSVVAVHDGVRPLPQAAPAVDGPLVLAVGARVAHKGHATLAQAAGLLPGVDIGLAGAGPLTPPGLRYLGHRPDIAALHAAARVFVQPSLMEGMGQAVVEAMLAGLPVVVSDAGGLPEVVGDAAIVVPRGDAAALADGIRRALAGQHPPLDRARERAERFSVDAMVRGSLAVYRRVLPG